MNLQRRYPIGGELQPGGSTHFRVWAPRPTKVEVVLEAGSGAPAAVKLKQEADGYFAGLVPHAAEFTRYRFQRRLAHPGACRGGHAPSEKRQEKAWLNWFDLFTIVNTAIRSRTPTCRKSGWLPTAWAETRREP